MEVIRAAVKLGSGAHKIAAVTSGNRTHSYAQLLRSAWELSTKLRDDRDGLEHKNKALQGARVGIVAAPSAEFVVGIWGTWLSGGVAVPLALSHPESELHHVFTDANITLVISTDDHKSLVEGVSQKAAARLFILPSIPSLEEGADGSEGYDQILDEVLSLSHVKDEELGLIIYTSGTTGRPKGAVHSQGALAAQVAMLSSAWQYKPSDRFLHCLPLHHVHGLFNALLAPLYAGSSVHFIPKFSVTGVWQCWRESYPSKNSQAENPITCFTGVPTMYVRLLQGYESMNAASREAAASAARRLRLMMCGSSALPLPVFIHWEKVTGHRLLERYGMTEFGMGLSNPLDGERRPGSVGVPLPGVVVKIEPESAESEPGTGELCVKSPSMFSGYWNQPTVTQEAFDEDGFFKTGDFVKQESDGYIRILGRTSVDILKSGGYKLSALEIESMLLEHPDISECAVLGIPDKDYGEVIAAVVILDTENQSDVKMTLPQLRDWALKRMAPYKIPQRLHVWESLPRNAMGKVNKKELKSLLTTIASSRF
ncbi:malonate--CoA ligase [Selaginella moellendorffii]|uniref:malonate--CoA ligase n=1 Tax=Selaginella moellendorffii TaxID=88036 RepID=UPI000D1C51B6|nr:malonate--CoA ligase [Selaginella moellendorffii]XP_024519885.1 malonate--CoA ligase [Selaginella moellendorffii]|eukprot:XP_024519884.1 malonate--CoA ligase [Selaginella moellendorffii]